MLWSRFDGQLARDVPPYRRMMPFIMRGRNESAVYFEQIVDLSRTLDWLERTNADSPHRMTLFHVVLGAIPRVIEQRPHLNRFVAGKRIYQRDGVWLSFAAKKRMADDAPLSIIKRRFEPDEPLLEMVARLAGEVADARSDKLSHVDKEVVLLLRLPRSILSFAVWLLGRLDAWNLAPRALIEPDPMFASMFIANLGSLKIDAAYHHLYEYGNCPFFLTIGRIERLPLVDEQGAVAVRSVARLKYSFDERIEDGLYCARVLELLRGYIEDPEPWAGSEG